MKLCPLFLVALLALASTAAWADTVYFSNPNGDGIESVSGTIVKETDNVVEVTTKDGRTVSVPRGSVYQIIRDAPSEAGKPTQTDPFELTREWPSSTGRSKLGDSPSSKRRYHYGLVGGMNFSNMSVDPQEFEDEGSLKSFAVGGWWGLPLTRRLALRTEALYSVKGDAESGDGYTAKTRMSYIDVPVLARVGFMHDAAARPSLFVGPSLAVNLSAKSTFEGGGSDADVDVKDKVRPLDVGIVVGGGVDIPLGGHTYGLELRYTKGLSNAAGEEAHGSAHNDVLAVMGSIGL
jgi:hypothetical protein